MVKLLERVKFLELYITPKGMEDLGGAIRAWRREYGEKWLAEFTNANPDLSTVVTLIAKYDFPEAFERLKKHVDAWIDAEPDETFWDNAKRIGMRATAHATLDEYQPKIEVLHRTIRAEIDRPQF